MEYLKNVFKAMTFQNNKTEFDRIVYFTVFTFIIILFLLMVYEFTK